MPRARNSRRAPGLRGAASDPAEHKFEAGICRVCVKCAQCTGLGPTCPLSNDEDKASKVGKSCGCGQGNAGCTVCGVCDTCGSEQGCVLPPKPALSNPPPPPKFTKLPAASLNDLEALCMMRAQQLMAPPERLHIIEMVSFVGRFSDKTHTLHLILTPPPKKKICPRLLKPTFHLLFFVLSCRFDVKSSQDWKQANALAGCFAPGALAWRSLGALLPSWLLRRAMSTFASSCLRLPRRGPPQKKPPQKRPPHKRPPRRRLPLNRPPPTRLRRVGPMQARQASLPGAARNGAGGEGTTPRWSA